MTGNFVDHLVSIFAALGSAIHSETSLVQNFRLALLYNKQQISSDRLSRTCSVCHTVWLFFIQTSWFVPLGHIFFMWPLEDLDDFNGHYVREGGRGKQLILKSVSVTVYWHHYCMSMFLCMCIREGFLCVLHLMDTESCPSSASSANLDKKTLPFPCRRTFCCHGNQIHVSCNQATLPWHFHNGLPPNPHANMIIITMLFTHTSITVIILNHLKGYYPFKFFPRLFVTMLNLVTLPSWWFLWVCRGTSVAPPPSLPPSLSLSITL